MIIKNILGFCACKGCHKRQQFAIEVKAGNKKKIFKYCEKHAKELMKMGKIKSVTYEETIEL